MRPSPDCWHRARWSNLSFSHNSWRSHDGIRMSTARIRWISGPVLRAGTQDIFHVYEAIAVGPQALLGEVIKLGPDDFVAQIYEDTRVSNRAMR